MKMCYYQLLHSLFQELLVVGPKEEISSLISQFCKIFLAIPSLSSESLPLLARLFSRFKMYLWIYYKHLIQSSIPQSTAISFSPDFCEPSTYPCVRNVSTLLSIIFCSLLNLRMAASPCLCSISSSLQIRHIIQHDPFSVKTVLQNSEVLVISNLQVTFLPFLLA